MIVMGRVVAPYGVKGWIKVRPFTRSTDALLVHRQWWLAKKEDDWREFALVEGRRHGGMLVVRLEGLSRREDAVAWGGAAIGVPRAGLPELAAGEVYLADLIGLKVVNRQGERVGQVGGVLETPAHAVLQVADENGSEELIPLVPAYIDAIELANGRIIVDWRIE
jgi:16S rRNA processing protein RimM